MQAATSVHITRCEPVSRYAARLTFTTGKCLRSAWKLTSNVSFAPGLPRTNAQGLAHGEPRGHRLQIA